jgi:hypothetical protein
MFSFRPGLGEREIFPDFRWSRTESLLETDSDDLCDHCRGQDDRGAKLCLLSECLMGSRMLRLLQYVNFSVYI